MTHDLPLRGRSLVCLSTIDWDFLWQGHQEIMSRLAAAGNRVVFVENSGVRTIGMRDLGRVVSRLFRWVADTAGPPRSPVRDLTLVAPLLLPFPRSLMARSINDRFFLPRLARRVLEITGPDPIVFTYLPTHNALRLIELLRGPRSVVVYYCVADFSQLSDLGPTMLEIEASLARVADLVFVQGPVFADRLAGLNPRVYEFKSGVNLELFDPDRVRAPLPEIARLSRPIIGYAGGLHAHLDQDLLRQTARTLREATIVLVGPVQTDVSALASEPNVKLLPARPIAEIPAVVSSFDVGVIPYARTPYTETVYPTKLYEYLAMGIPVVATRLPELQRLGLPPGALRLADGTASFVDAVRDALREGGSERMARVRIAMRHDWGRIVYQMADLIVEREQEKRG